MITLYKGDDTGGQLGKNVKIVFHCDDAVDMDDVVVKFDLLGIVKREFTDVHDGDVLDIFISHAESRKFPLGVIFAKMWGEDASGKLRTFANRIPFRVTLNLIAVYGSDGTDSQDIHVYSSVDWDSIANKPTVFPSSVEEVEGLQEALDDINGKIPEDASAENQLADKDWVDQEIDRVAAYYITSDAQGNPFQTRAALLNAETYYSGGSPRTPTRNDYAIVLADESYDNTEWRYIYSVNEQGVGTWEAQYPVEGAIVADDNVTKTSTNPVKSSGIWSALWGALTALPTGFTSLYDWCVSQLAGKVPTSRTVNGKALDADVTLTGADIAVSGTDATKIDSALAGKASTADATLTERGFSEWTIVVSPPPGMEFEAVGQPYYENHRWYLEVRYRATGEEEWEYSNYDQSGDEDALHVILGTFFDCTRTALQGYQLGAQTDKPLASEAEAEALRTGKQDALTSQQLANIAAVPNKANRAANPTAGNLAALDANGNPTDAGWTAGDLARYSLTTKTVSNNAVTLDDRATNIVTIDASITSVTFTFPARINGKMRDFFVRLIIQGTTVPTLYFNEPDGGGPVAFDADDDAWADIEPGVNILMFSDTAE